MMKKYFLFLLFAALPLWVSAQTPTKFAYFNYTEVLKMMPEYGVAMRNMADLRAKFDAETKRSENDFHAKYEEFLEGQRNFAPSILKKRQAELQEMMDKNIAFKKESDRLLLQAEKDAFAPAHARLKRVLAGMGHERGYAFILNADNNALPYVNNMVGEDITEALKTVIK